MCMELTWHPAQGLSFVRLIIFNKLQGYEQLIQHLEARTGSALCQVTMMMVLPNTISLKKACSVLQPRKEPRSLPSISAEQHGIGYSRLAIQLIASRLRLSWVWVMDDNVKQFCCLHYDAVASQAFTPQEKADRIKLQRIHFAEAMGHLERQVIYAANCCCLRKGGLLPLDCLSFDATFVMPHLGKLW